MLPASGPLPALQASSGPSWTLVYATLGVVWVLSAVGGGAALAALARRLHPGLSFRKLWIFFSGLLAFAVAAYFAIALRSGL